MRFTPPTLDAIRARLPISAIVGRRVTWDRRKSAPAKGDYWACCPFHQEKTPSFHCDDRRGIYHCFGCGATGDHFRFVVETEGLTFPEAVERLANEAGVALPTPDPRESRRERQRASLGQVVELAAAFFQSQLAGPAGEAARDYLLRRRVTAETIAEFRIGFAPAERDALKRHLAAQGIDESQMAEAGLVIRPEDGRPAYDRFRGRVMIPIEDERGRVVAFGGRVLGAEEPKYLNSPETPLFHKSAVLFNVHRARPAAHKAGSVIVTEGYLDAIAVWQAGARHVVATLGTAFTEEQIARLWRLAPEPVVCFDGDRAGITAAHRAIDRMLPALRSGYSFNFAFLPDGQDPDDLVRAGGREAFMAEIARAAPLAEVLWARETAAAPIDTPERKAALETRLDRLLGDIADARVRRRYQLDYRIRLARLFWAADRNRGPRGGRGSPAEPGAQAPSPGQESRKANIERVVLGMCVEYSELLEENIERIVTRDYDVPEHQRFAAELYRLLVESDELSVNAFYDRIGRSFFDALDEVHGEERRIEERTVAERGHNLFRRVPILKLKPAADYVERLFELFQTKAELMAVEHECEERINAAAADEAALDGALSLIAERNGLRAHEQALERLLDEEAHQIRRRFGLAAA